MNSQQIREALRGLTALVPAIGNAADIVESAEQAEVRLAEIKRDQAAVEKVITDLSLMRQDFEAKMQAAKQALNDVNNGVAERKAAIEAELKKVRDQIEKARDELDELDTKYDEKKAERERELASLLEQIASAKKRHAEFLKSLGA